MPPLRALSRADPLETMRRAAARLAPSWVELPSPRPRLLGYASAVREIEGGPALVLAPIDAGRALGVREDEGVVVRSGAPEVPFLLRARRVIPIDARTLAVPLDGARLELPRRRRRARRRADGQVPLMLVAPAGLHGVEAHVLPILDLGAEGCAVDTVAPLEPGRTHAPVEIVGARGVLRTAEATVREVVPWATPAGELRFRCQLALAPTNRLAADPVDDLVSSAERTRRVLELAAMVERAAWVAEGLGPRRDGRLLASDGRRLTVRVAPVAGDPPPGRPATTVRLGFDLFGVSYEGDARVLAREGDQVDLAYPLVLRRHRRRRKPRVEVPRGEDVTLSFTNPVGGPRETRRVIDASLGGLCFAADAHEDVLWPGLCLEEGTLRWRGREVGVGDLTVRSVDASEDGAPTRCHVEIRSAPRIADDAMLVDLLATFGHPRLRVHDGADFPDVIATYRAAGLLGDFMLRNLAPVAPQSGEHWQRAHGARVPIVRTLMHPESGPVDATLSALRAWDRTWLIQHFGALSADGFRWSGELQSAMLDWIIPRPDGDYLLFFVHAANPRMNAFYERFVELTGTPEATARHGVALWTLPADAATDAPTAPGAGVARPALADDEAVIGRAAEAIFGPMIAKALSFQPGELDLPGCRARFARVALERGRDVELVAVDGAPRVALLHETMSSGLNLTWMQQATWILPVGADALDPRGVAATLAAIRRRPPPSPAGDRFALLPRGVSGEPLADGGWTHLLDAHVYVMNRPGLHRFHHYVADRYGEVGVRKERRRSRGSMRAVTDDAADTPDAAESAE